MPDNLKFSDVRQQTLAYLLDRGLAVLILWAIYNIATDMGARWIEVQSKLVDEMVTERRASDDRMTLMVEMARSDDVHDKQIMEQFSEAIEGRLEQEP